MVDDDLYNIEVVTAMLDNLKHPSESAISGTSALVKMQDRIELMREGKAQMYKIILLDYSMPELDGP